METWDLKPAADLALPPLQRLRSVKRESGLVSTGMHLAWWTLVRGYFALWHRLAVSGREHLPKAPPFVLAANHASHLDALALAAPLSWRLRDRVYPIAAGDVFFETPLLTTFAAVCLNALPMWRKKCGPHALQELRKRLVEEPGIYILFPEGARSRDGSMASFKAGLGMLLARTSVPVVPCYLEGCFEALRPETKWPRRWPIRLHISEPLHFADVEDNREGWVHIAKTTEAAVKRLAPHPACV